jgi:CrcB protein
MVGSLSTRRRILAVFCGGFLGTLLRYTISILIQGWAGKGWPFDIVLINISGAFVLAFVTILADSTFLVGPTRRLFINVGLLGAYTTFSSMALGDVLLFAGGMWLAALLYIATSMIGGVLAVLAGDWIGRWFINKARRTTKQSRITRKLIDLRPELDLDTTDGKSHLDIQDDVLLPGWVDEYESRRY